MFCCFIALLCLIIVYVFSLVEVLINSYYSYYITIAEDLTSKNAKLLSDLKKLPEVEASWSWGGKIYAKHRESARAKRYDIFDL